MKREITITKELNAPVEKVWSAWTDPAQVAQWWGPDGVTIPTCTLDARVGGEFYIVMLAGAAMGPMAGQEWPMKGTFTEVVENTLLVFTNIALDTEGNHLLEGKTTVTFEADGDKTNLTIITGAGGEGPNVEQMLAGMEPGWRQQVEKLGEFVAKQ